MGLGVGGNANLEPAGGVDHALDEFVTGAVADSDGHWQRHAALAGRAVGRADDVLDRLIHIGVGHDDAVVLGPAHALHALTVGGAVHVNVVGDVRRADEGDGADLRRLQQAVDRFLVAMDDVEHAGRATRFYEQLGEPNRHGGVFF